MQRTGRRMSVRAGLAMVAALAALGGCSSRDLPAVQAVAVVLSDDRFAPDHLSFRRGTTYRLHLENRGKELHEFTAPEFFKAVRVRNPEALVPDGHEVVLQPGDSRDVEFVPIAAGKFPLTCADHDWDGMVGEIVVD